MLRKSNKKLVIRVHLKVIYIAVNINTPLIYIYICSVPFQPTGTNIVTNTAPTPGVRMRVIRKNGETATMVGLGEDLQLRIEIDQESAFGLFARKLEARTDNGELMNLIDDSGCPVNELIFPALDLETETRALFADFKAFRFPSTPIVNFIATVQFCQDLCDPVSSSLNK